MSLLSFVHICYLLIIYLYILPSQVGLADRSLMPGDVVRRLIRGKDTQRGYCRQVHVTSSVQIVGTKLVILNVDSNDLTPLEVSNEFLILAPIKIHFMKSFNCKNRYNCDTYKYHVHYNLMQVCSVG